jgi:hypothetical protein
MALSPPLFLESSNQCLCAMFVVSSPLGGVMSASFDITSADTESLFKLFIWATCIPGSVDLFSFIFFQLSQYSSVVQENCAGSCRSIDIIYSYQIFNPSSTSCGSVIKPRRTCSHLLKSPCSHSSMDNCSVRSGVFVA